MLDTTFSALADPTRRAIVSRLRVEDALNVTDVAKPFAMSLPAVIKHLNVLAEAGLVQRTRSGRTVTCRLVREPLEEAMFWLDRHARFWSARLDNLAAVAEADHVER